MDIIEYTPMEKMEIFLRSLPSVIEEFDVQNQVMPNSGIMVRTLKMKAGEVIIGKIHTEWNVNILASGSMYVTSNPEDAYVKVDAPYVFETGPGSQKFGMCITDCVFMNAIRCEDGETGEEVVDRMTKESRVTNSIEKEKLCQ